MVKLSDRQKVRKAAYDNGDALKRHIDTVHNGKAQPDCRACNEIKAKGKQ